MTSYQNAIDKAKDKMQVHGWTAAQANVYIVQLMGVRIIQAKLPKDVRTALNEAVKAGELGHIKKEGLKPEAYHHKNARPRALEERDRIERQAFENLTKVYAKPI